MNLKKLSTFGILSLMLSTACTHIDSFDSPHMLEGFTGVVKVTPGIAGITSKTYTPGLVFFNGSKSGKSVVMYGPGTSNFSLYSILPDDDAAKKQLRDHMERQGVSPMDKLDFSGFRGYPDPTDGKKLIFNKFGDQSAGMEKFGWKVEGTGLVDGPDSYVTIKISVRVSVLQKLLPSQLLDKLSAEGMDVPLSKVEDKNTVVYLAQIDVLGEGITPY